MREIRSERPETHHSAAKGYPEITGGGTKRSLAEVYCSGYCHPEVPDRGSDIE